MLALHTANVLAGIFDNDENGSIDQPEVLISFWVILMRKLQPWFSLHPKTKRNPMRIVLNP